MWPPVSELLVPHPSTTIEVPQSVVQPELQVSVHTVDCRPRYRFTLRRSLRGVARTEPLYRRANGTRQEPYPISGTLRQIKKNATPTDQEQAVQLGITNDDIQAAGILMLISKSHEVQSGELSVYQDDPVNTITQSEMSTHNSEMCVCCACTLPTNWLQTLGRQSCQRLLRILCGMWNENVHLVIVSLTVPSVSVPVVLQQAMHVAGLLVNLAHLKKMPKEQDICCADCGALPVTPVTGECGHIRCMQCVNSNSSCACGAPAPAVPRVDICVQNLVAKILLSNNQPPRDVLRAPDRPPVRGQPLHDIVCAILNTVNQENGRRTVAQGLSRGPRVSLAISPDSFTAPDVLARLPMTPQARVLHACEQIRRLRYPEAAAHLARAATYAEFHVAEKLLVQTIEILLEDREPELVLRELAAAVGEQAAESWLTPEDLECALCRDTFVVPVTTPCGHTYCRGCIECTMDYKRECPLCLRDLTDFNLAVTGPSGFAWAALDALDLLRSPPALDPDFVPVFICVSAYPNVSCPLLISAPRYRAFIRRILESGSRRLGIVARNDDYTDSFGTMVEVRDCVDCEDGQMFLSTVGVSRFRIVERLKNSCLARVETLTDMLPEDRLAVAMIRDIGGNVMSRSRIWLKNLKRSVRKKLEQVFGKLPKKTAGEWWNTTDGPDWLWWLVASLPLAPDTQSMLIATPSLLTRLRVVQRTLKVVTETPNAGRIAFVALRQQSQ